VLIAGLIEPPSILWVELCRFDEHSFRIENGHQQQYFVQSRRLKLGNGLNQGQCRWLWPLPTNLASKQRT